MTKPTDQFPRSDFEKLGGAITDFKKALYEHHPLFILARKLVELWMGI